jgi:hypothetical protein
MQKTLLLLLLIICTVSCRLFDKNASRFDNVSKTDTTCLKELELAKADIKNGKLVYCHNAGSMLYQKLRGENHMISLLKKYNISYSNITTSDVIYEGQTQNCYGDYMEEQIKNKYGTFFLDSLLAISDSLCAFSNHDTLHYSQCDTWPRYPSENLDEEFSKKIQEQFNHLVTYPKGYIKKENQEICSFVDVSFVVDKTGKTSNIGFWFMFDHKENQKLEKHFEEIIKPLILDTTWQPATVRKRKVTSDMNIRIELK